MMNGVKEMWSSSTKLISPSKPPMKIDDEKKPSNNSSWFDAESMSPCEYINKNNDSLQPEVTIINNSPENRKIKKSKFLFDNNQSNNNPEESNDFKNIKINKSSNDIDTNHSAIMELGNDAEVLYQNNAEALTSLSIIPSKYSTSIHQSTCSMSLDSTTKENIDDSICDKKRRHSSSVEIAAMTSIKTNEDGVPVISFSFLQTEQKKISVVDGACQEIETDIIAEVYDVPRCDQRHLDGSKIEENETLNDQMGQEIFYDTTDQACSDLYDIPISKRSIIDEKLTNCDGGLIEDDDKKEEFLYEIPIPKIEILNKRNSLNVDNNSLEKNINCQGFDLDNDNNIHEQEKGKNNNNNKKNSLGKALIKMRCWLRDEKLKIGDVVQRHSKLQAVGAMKNNNNNNSPSSSRSGSYDLVEAREREMSKYKNNIDEFGLSSVSEEVNLSEPGEVELTSYDMKPEKKLESNDDKVFEQGSIESSSPIKRTILTPGILRKKTLSSENLTGNKRTMKLTSFSLDQLYDDIDNANEEKNKRVVGVGGGGGGGEKEEEKDQAGIRHMGKRGLIKRRMLGSIRGLMASTNLLHQHDTEEVYPYTLSFFFFLQFTSIISLI